MKKLAVLGASYLQLPIIKKAKTMGVETHCFAWDNNQAVCKEYADYFYPISVLDREQILQKCKEINIDGITTIATDICIPTIAYVAQEFNLDSNNSLESAVNSTNKAKMRIALQKGDVNCPKSICISTYKDEIFEGFSFPMIVKPTDRSGSRGVSKVSNKEELKNAIKIALSESLEKKVVVEEFIEGCEVSVESISWKGKHHILAITDKVTTGKPYFVELEHHQPSLLSLGIQDRVKKETLKALKSLDIEYGASHTEIKINDEGNVYIIEVGARMGGDFIGSHLVELSTGYDFVQGVIEIALGIYNKPTRILNDFSGVYFLSDESKYLLPYFEEDNQVIVKKEIINLPLKQITNSNDRSGYLIYKANSKLVLK